jgi:hypothetical protein
MLRKTKEEINILLAKALEDYKNNFLIKTIIEKHNLQHSTFVNFLKSKNIQVRKRKETLLLQRNYDCFKTIDTEEKAYWLGFIASDGCITKEMNQVKISLKGSDIRHLEKFKVFINTPVNITKRFIKCNNKLCDVVTIVICNEKICQDLIKLGCTPKKSLTLDIKLDLINQDFIKDFWRGYIDGDGSIRKGKRITLSFLSTLEMCTKALEYFKNFVDLDTTKYKYITCLKTRVNNSYSLAINGVKAKIILDLLYKDSTIFLNRKKEIYEKIQ